MRFLLCMIASPVGRTLTLPVDHQYWTGVSGWANPGGTNAMTDILTWSRLVADLSRMGLVEGNVGGMLTRLCATAVGLLDVRGAAVLLLDEGGRLHCVAASDAAVLRAQAQQVDRWHESLAGPGDGSPTVLLDLASPGLVQSFAREPAAPGLHAGHAFVMRAGQQRLGILAIYQDATRDLPQTSRHAAQALADFAASLEHQRRLCDDAQRLAEQLQHALDSRVLIEQAKGVLSVRLGIPPEFAFQGLRRYARSHRERISDVAQRVITGEVPLEDLKAELRAENVVRLQPAARRPSGKSGR
jgi:hypothetical protein